MQKITIIGTGNVAEHLAKSLFENGFNILQIVGRKIQKTTDLASKVKAEPITNLQKMDKNSDLYLLCITDSALSEVVENIKFEPKLIAHTAGSVSINVLQKFKNYGIFYPLQTFTKSRNIDIKKVPFCLDANTNDNLTILQKIANKLSDKLLKMNDKQRMQCHLAAVFACNFTNYFYSLASDILEEENIPFGILHPLIQETVQKAIDIHPKNAQTGPAIRGNTEIINKHLKQLKNEDLKKLYSFVSEIILKESFV